MQALPRIVKAPMLGAALILALASGAPGVSQAATAHMSPVSIAITATGGTVWGTVIARYKMGQKSSKHACSAASCTLQVPTGVTLHLSQTPRNTATWPFKGWQIS